MARGVDLNIGSAGGGGSPAVQQSTSDPVAGALQGAGRTLLSVGVSNIAANRKEEEAAAKATAALEKERQTIFDSSHDAFVRNQSTIAIDAVKATIIGNPGNTKLWNETSKDTWDQVFENFEETSEGLSEEAKRKQAEFLTKSRTAAEGVLNIQMVGAETKAANDNWRLNAQLAADEGDEEAFANAISQVQWTNDAERREFELDTWRAGRYNEINNEMLALDSPDKLTSFAKEIEAMGSKDLNKSQRNTLAVVAKQRAIKMQVGYNTTMRAYQRDLKRGEEIDPARLTDDIALNRISPEMVVLVELQMEEMARKSTYKADYDRDRFSITYIRAADDIIGDYLDPDEAPENVELDSKAMKELVEKIDGLRIGEWAKGDLYSLAFQAKTEALRQPDHSWGIGMSTELPGVAGHPILGPEVDRDIGDDERDFRMSYTQQLQTIMKQGQVVMPGLADQFITNDVAITKAFAGETPSDPKKAMEDLLRPMINGMMNAELKRKMAGGTDGAPAQTATNPATGEKLVLKNGKWVPFE